MTPNQSKIFPAFFQGSRPASRGRGARFFVALGACLSASQALAGPPPGQLLASQCFQCHGTNGRAVSGFESISGKPASDMYKQLLEMSQRPPETIMDLQAAAYTPEQLKAIAAYLATLPASPQGDE